MPTEQLRGQLKAAHEALCAAQPQCVILASRHQLQAAIDRISYVAAREGIDPGDTFSPLADLRTDVLDQLPVTTLMAAEEALTDRLAEALRLTAEWGMATALPGWSWFDALNEYHAARGHDPLPATGLAAGITVHTAPADGPYHVATVTIDAAGNVHGYANADAPMPTITVEPGTEPGLYHVMSDGTWVAQPGFGNSGQCTRACTEGHTYEPPCELARDRVDAEALWTLAHIADVLDQPFVEEHMRAKALRMLRRHEELHEQEAETATAVAAGPQPPIPELGEERGAIRGVPFLLEQLARLAGQSVYLWCRPMAQGYMPWCIWTGPPSGTSGGRWGEGETAAEALADAYRNLTSAIFDGRVVR